MAAAQRIDLSHGNPQRKNGKMGLTHRNHPLSSELRSDKTTNQRVLHTRSVETPWKGSCRAQEIPRHPKHSKKEFQSVEMSWGIEKLLPFPAARNGNKLIYSAPQINRLEARSEGAGRVLFCAQNMDLEHPGCGAPHCKGKKNKWRGQTSTEYAESSRKKNLKLKNSL